MRDLLTFSSVKTKFYLAMTLLVVVTQLINGLTLVNARQQEIAEDILFNALLFAEYNAEEIVEYYGEDDDPQQQELFALMDGILQKNRDIEAIYVINEHNQLVVTPHSFAQRQALVGDLETAGEALIARMQSGEPSTQSSLYRGHEVIDILYPMEGEYGGKEYFVHFLFNYKNQEQSIAQMQRQMLVNGLGSFLVGLLLIVAISSHFTKPIRQLVNHVKQVSKGDFSSKINITSRDELGALSHAFNGMQSALAQSFGQLTEARDQLAQLNANLEQRVAERTEELHEKNIQLERMSITDKLTDVYNRAKLDIELEKEFERYQRYQQPFALVMIDLDFFKQVNDNFGHHVGDSVLQESAALFLHTVRETDILGRWGGEEFMVICPNTSKDRAISLAERIRNAIEQHEFAHVGKRTASLGVSMIEPGDTFETLSSRADTALYQAKEHGRNKVKFA
ncbi:sensor domain-containing diguanylate cyclase [Aliagarivorans taiwanensis]|uniref:sensor domain-containing diguanylate cyclase n=1 Tax=Aliagarivorans taiwanensis TaxID=561966 RepID=UPI00041557D9|nr:diguanylate cyclase [Aliagarivorans taiwanensis]